MKKALTIMLLAFLSCKDVQQSYYSFQLLNTTNQEIVLNRFPLSINNAQRTFVIKPNQIVEFAGAVEVLSYFPTGVDSVVVLLENNLKIIDACRSLNSSNCQKNKSFFDIASYKKSVDESRKALRTTFLYEFTNEDLKKAK